MAEDSRAIVTDVSDSVAIVRLNRPAQRNSLSLSTLRELESALSTINRRNEVTTIIVTGSEDVFASGADIRELSQLNSHSAFKFARTGQAVFQKIADAQQLTIAVINGYCIGGGMDLALACDVRIASPSAVFSHPGAARGIITGWGGTQRLPRLIGRARAMEFFATAGKYTSRTALEFGLVSYVGDDVMEHALSLAKARS